MITDSVKKLFFRVACVAGLCSQTATGAEVDRAMAETAARHWVEREGRACGWVESEAATIESRIWTDNEGHPGYHVVRTGSATVLLTADDRMEPVVGILSGEDWSWMNEADHPLQALLAGDLAVRRAAAQEAEDPARKSGQTSPREKWTALLAETPERGTRAGGNGSATADWTRVGSLLSTAWNQEKNTHGMWAYNLHSPKRPVPEAGTEKRNARDAEEEEPVEEGDPAPCGCVATAGAQVMRHFRWPSARVQQKTVTCNAFGESTNMTLFGGPYGWTKMGGSQPVAESARDAVSVLTHDIGVACGASFSDANFKRATSIALAKFVNELTSTFRYSQAVYTSFSSYDATAIKRVVYPNLQAGCPVLMGIKTSAGAKGGHCVVVDGAGTLGGEFALHVNFGWGGTGNLWYKPPHFQANSVNPAYAFIHEMGYNIAKTATGELLAGWVSGPNGRPVKGANVAIVSGTELAASLETGANGQYWHRGMPGTYTVLATGKDGAKAEATVTLQTSGRSQVGNQVVDLRLDVPAAAKVTSSPIPLKAGIKDIASDGTTRVVLACATEGAEIRYTLDGTAPTPSSLLYEGPLLLQKTAELRAVAFAEGLECSETLAERWEIVDSASRDAFADARELFAAEGEADFDNEGCSLENGEPMHSSDGYDGGASVWAKWTAPSDGLWTFALAGTKASDGGAMDTQLAVYSGEAVNVLTRVAANDDRGNDNYSSRVCFAATSGTTYRIAMDSYGGEAGTMTLNWTTGMVYEASLSQAGQFMPVEGGLLAVRVASTTNWFAGADADWIEVETAEGDDGGELVCRVAANESGAVREGTVSVMPGDGETGNPEPAVLSITQSPLSFCTNQAAAVARAAAGNKRILLVSGREGCANTRSVLFSGLPSANVRPRLEAGYVLWYNNCDRDWMETWRYASGLGSYYLPLVCVLDSDAGTNWLARTTGPQSAAQLAGTLGHVVVFHPCGGSIATPLRYLADGDALGELPIPVLAGREWRGWFEDKAGSREVTAATRVGTNGTTHVYALWSGDDSTTETPVPVPHAWLEEWAPTLLANHDGDFEATAAAIAANGCNAVWECYLAGLDPEDSTAFFKIALAWADGSPVFSWSPEALDGRVYVLEGAKTLDGPWETPTAASRFYRVSVNLKE